MSIKPTLEVSWIPSHADDPIISVASSCLKSQENIPRLALTVVFLRITVYLDGAVEVEFNAAFRREFDGR